MPPLTIKGGKLGFAQNLIFTRHFFILGKWTAQQWHHIQRRCRYRRKRDRRGDPWPWIKRVWFRTRRRRYTSKTTNYIQYKWVSADGTSFSNLPVLDTHPDPENNFPRNNIESTEHDVVVIQGPKVESEPEHPSPTSGPEVTMNRKTEDRHTSFFAQPGILAGKWGCMAHCMFALTSFGTLCICKIKFLI